MPTPLLPPFPLVDARYDKALKKLNPIHLRNIPGLAEPQSNLTRNHFGARLSSWSNANSLVNTLMTTAGRRRIVEMAYESWFVNKRHYEAVQMLGLAREIQARRPDAAALFNRQYEFELIPVPSSVDASEYLIFLNVRPRHRDRKESEMAPPEPGTKVEIKSQQGRSEESSTSQVRSHEMPNIGQLKIGEPSTRIAMYARPVIETITNEVTWTGLVVPNPTRTQDELEICIYIRLLDLQGTKLGPQKGNFSFGSIHHGAHAQAEQAIRLAMHGDGSFYSIPPVNWMQEVLFGHENRALGRQGVGQIQTSRCTRISIRNH
jgi:hypothetical protein